MEDQLFDNGIDGEPYSLTTEEDQAERYSDDWYESTLHREDYDVHNANGLEVKGWPTYGNYTIISPHFHVYYWPGNNTLDIHTKLPEEEFAGVGSRHVLTITDKNLFFFGEAMSPDEDGKVNVAFYTGEQVDKKIQQYLSLKAFL